MDLIYLYGALAGGGHFNPGILDINGRKIELDSIIYGEVAVIYGFVPGNIFFTRSRKEFLDWVMIHHQVLNHLYSRAKLIPFKPGMTLTSVNELSELIKSNRSTFLNLFRTVKDMDEWDIIVNFTDMRQVLLRAGEDPAVKKLKEEALTKKNLTQQDLIPIGRLVEAVIKGWKNEIAGGIIKEIESVTNHVFVNDRMDENTVLSLGFLSTPEGAEKVEIYLNSLPSDFNYLQVKMVGPMPPFSFFTIEVKSLKKENISQALRTLGIAGVPVYRDVLKAKRAILQRIHPDKRTEEDSGTIQPILDAFDLLDYYYRHKEYSVNELEDLFVVETVNIQKNEAQQAGESVAAGHIVIA
ncbi:MAG: GvpL/GvpF family gas vesicle protein [Bacillota bacterium]